MAEEYLTFDETAKKLGISEDDLLNLVSSNALRAFRIDRETKFRVEDINAHLGISGDEAAPLALEESAVLELDDLPDDVVLVDEEPQVAEEQTITPPEEPEVVATAEPQTPGDNNEESKMTGFEKIDSESDDTGESDIIDFDDSDIKEVKETSLEDTMATSSASNLDATEAIAPLEDDDFDLNTQEVTIQEEAISDDDIGSETLTEETLEVDDVEEEEVAPKKAPPRRARRSAVASRSRISSVSDDDSGDKKGLLWTVIIAAVCILMLYPSTLVAFVLFKGYSDSADTISPGSQSFGGTIQNIGAPFVPSIFKVVKSQDLANAFGRAEYGNNLTRFVPIAERIEMGLVEVDQDAESAKKGIDDEIENEEEKDEE